MPCLLKLVPEKELVIGIKSQLPVEGLKRLTLPLYLRHLLAICASSLLALFKNVWTKFKDADKWYGATPLGFKSEQEYIMCEIEEREKKNPRTCFEGSNTTTMNCGHYHFWGSKRGSTNLSPLGT